MELVTEFGIIAVGALVVTAGLLAVVVSARRAGFPRTATPVRLGAAVIGIGIVLGGVILLVAAWDELGLTAVGLGVLVVMMGIALLAVVVKL